MKKIMLRLMVFMSKRMIACDEAGFLISYRQDRRLGFRRWWSLKMHLLTCHLCRKYARQIEELSRILVRYHETCESDICTHHLHEESGMRIQETVTRELNAN